MSKPRHQATNAIGDVAKQVADVAEDKVAEARKRVDDAVEHGRELYSDIRARALEGAKVAGEFIREKPYAAAGIGLGLGVLIGFCCEDGVGVREVITSAFGASGRTTT